MWADRVCSLPSSHLLRVWRGYRAGRSGQIQMLPRRPNFVGEWLSHSGPWPYLQRVPLFLYGPGHVPALGRIHGRANLADVAPTIAAHLGFALPGSDGRVLDESVDDGGPLPRLVVVVVWDGGGRNVLAEHRGAWSFLSSLIPEGVWFEDAVVGTSPSVTPAVHATLGTGLFPRRHGVVDLRFLFEGRLASINRETPRYQLEPTLADRYDRERGNKPVVGMVGPRGTLGMLGSGSLLAGADRDVAAIERSGRWQLGPLQQPFFRFPSAGPGNLDRYAAALDGSDGRRDGTWMRAAELSEPATLAKTPAFSGYQARYLRAVIRSEGFGRDRMPDLLYTNFKQIDGVGHEWSMNSPQMEAVVRSGDHALGELVRFLDHHVGEGEWLVVVTADHGETPRPELTGAYTISLPRLARDLDEAFDADGDGRPAVMDLRVTQIWMDLQELAEKEHTLGDVARFLAGYTEADNAAGAVPAERADRPVFETAFPSAVLETAPCLAGGAGGGMD
jgi:Type I phosphodiesterase / nucleotide pyrophosphatase